MASLKSSDTFESMQELREKLKTYALLNNCPYYLKYSRPSRLEACCPSTRLHQVQNNACGFRVTAYKRKIDSLIHLQILELLHSDICSLMTPASEYGIKQAATPFVASFGEVKPRDIMNLIRDENGISSSYSTAWRALNNIKREWALENDESFKLLESYLEAIVIENPGTVTSIERALDGSFNRMFLCPNATQAAFNYCRPLVIIDACHLRSKFGGIVMSACAHDGEGQIVPLAIGIVEVENSKKWIYFLRLLAKAIPKLKNPGMVLVHDREKGLHKAQVMVLPESHESICVFHLEKNVNCLFKSKFKGKIWAAAKATTTVEFQTAMRSIQDQSADAISYLLAANPMSWATSMFPVPSFGCQARLDGEVG